MGRRDWPPRTRRRRRPIRRVDHHPAAVRLALGWCTRRRLSGLAVEPLATCAGERLARWPSMTTLAIIFSLLLLLLLLLLPLSLPSLLPLPLLIPRPLPGTHPGAAAARGIWVAPAVVALR